MFSFAGATLLFVQFKTQRQQYVTSWIIGLCFVGVSVLLVSLKELLPEFIAYKIGNSLNIAGYVYFYYSCLSLLGKRINFNDIALKAFAAAIISIAALVSIGSVYEGKYQPVFVALCGAVFNLCTGLLVLKFYKKSQKQFAYSLFIAFLLTALIWAIRSILVLSGFLGFSFQGGVGNVLTFMLLLILGLTKYLSFAGLVTAIEWDKKEEFLNQLNIMKVDLANKEIKDANKKIERTEAQLLTMLNALAKARDNETGNHIIRTQNYVYLLAQNLRASGSYLDQLSDKSIAALVKAAPLHDIGKVGIPDSILLKKGSLTEEEWNVMKTHTLIGESVLGAADVESESDADVISKAIKLAGGHHEKWDGTGYPRGLSGQDIPLEARIMTVADMYDALVTERPYKHAWSHEEAIQEIISKQGTHLDPVIVKVLVTHQDLFREIAIKYKD